MAEHPDVADFRLTRTIAQKKIRSLARDSANLAWSMHARKRMEERGLTSRDVLRILQTGFVDEDPARTERGEWQCKITRKIRGGRDAGVVIIFLRDSRLLLKTVEWEDRR